MKHFLSLCLVLGAVTGCNDNRADAQRPERMPGEKSNKQVSKELGVRPDFNTKEFGTVKGELIDIVRSQGQSSDVQLLLGTKEGNILVVLGPDWYVGEGIHQLRPKDVVEVKGFKLLSNGNKLLIATELHVGSSVLKLRDSNGYSLWGGWRKS